MPQKRHSTEQIIAKLREADVDLSKGISVGQICRKLEISEHTFYRWRREYGGLKLDHVVSENSTALKRRGLRVCLIHWLDEPHHPVAASPSHRPVLGWPPSDVRDPLRVDHDGQHPNVDLFRIGHLLGEPNDRGYGKRNPLVYASPVSVQDRAFVCALLQRVSGPARSGKVSVRIHTSSGVRVVRKNEPPRSLKSRKRGETGQSV